MLEKLFNIFKKNKKIFIASMAIPIIIILGYFLRDIIKIGLAILFMIVMFNLDNISTYFKIVMNEKEQKKVEKINQLQNIQATIADILFRAFSGQLGKILQIIPPQVVDDVYPSTMPSTQIFNGITTFRFTAHRIPGSQTLTEDVMKRLVNNHLKKICLSGLLPPAPGSTFLPYLYVVSVTPDTRLPDTVILHLIYVDDAFSDAYVDNNMCEEAVLWQQQLIDSQTPDDEEF